MPLYYQAQVGLTCPGFRHRVGATFPWASVVLTVPSYNYTIKETKTPIPIIKAPMVTATVLSLVGLDVQLAEASLRQLSVIGKTRRHQRCYLVGMEGTWRFMGGHKWGYKSPNMGYKYSYPTHNPTYNYP